MVIIRAERVHRILQEQVDIRIFAISNLAEEFIDYYEQNEEEGDETLATSGN